MTTITLQSAVVVAPAIPAVTTTEVKILAVFENYVTEDLGPGTVSGPGRPGAVEVELLLDATNSIQRRITVWEGEDYKAVQGTWTDEDLKARIAVILANQ